MNEIVNKFLLEGDKLMPEFPETKKELKSFCKQEIQILFTEISLIKLAFNMIWFMVNQKI